jgi:hypothetical protein
MIKSTLSDSLSSLIKKRKGYGDESTEDLALSEKEDVLDEQQQDDIVAKFYEENAAIDYRFKLAMVCLSIPLALLYVQPAHY